MIDCAWAMVSALIQKSMAGVRPPSPVVVGRRYARQFEPPELHSIHKGTIVGLQEFGAFIRLEGCSRDGLVHASQMKHAEVRNPEIYSIEVSLFLA